MVDKHPFIDKIMKVSELILKTGIFQQKKISKDTLYYFQELNMHSLYFETFDANFVLFKF